MRIAVYSAHYGGRDPLNPDCLGTGSGYDRFVFSDDSDLVVPNASIVHDPLVGLDANRASRRSKLCPHRYFADYDWTVYIDNNASLTCDPVAMIEDLARRDHSGFFAFRHPLRDCLYHEGELCARAGKDHPAVIEAQMKAYRADGYPAGNGLVTATFLVRQGGRVDWAALGERWFEQILRYSRRDQLSFDYVAWKMGLKPDRLPGEVTDNAFMSWPVFTDTERRRDGVRRKDPLHRRMARNTLRAVGLRR